MYLTVVVFYQIQLMTMSSLPHTTRYNNVLKIDSEANFKVGIPGMHSVRERKEHFFCIKINVSSRR